METERAENQEESQNDAAPKLEPQPADQAGSDQTPPNIQEPVIKNGIKRADLPWQVVQLAESLPNDVALVGYFMLGADHVLMTTVGFYGLHEGSFSSLKVYVVVDNG